MHELEKVAQVLDLAGFTLGAEQMRLLEDEPVVKQVIESERKLNTILRHWTLDQVVLDRIKLGAIITESVQVVISKSMATAQFTDVPHIAVLKATLAANNHLIDVFGKLTEAPNGL